MVDAFVLIASTVRALISGIALWRIQPGAVRRAKMYFLFGAIPAVFLLNIFPFVFLAPPEQANNEDTASVIWIVIFTAGFVTWHAYLRKSRRVAATYPQG